MTINSVEEITYLDIEIKDKIGNSTYYKRVSDCDVWLQLFGESWESIYDTEKLEQLYQNYINEFQGMLKKFH